VNKKYIYYAFAFRLCAADIFCHAFWTGEATIRAIVERGGKVVIFDINEERGEAIAAELGSSAVLWPGPTDVAGEDSVQSSIEKGVEKFGQISGVINCGGIGMAQKVIKRRREMDDTTTE
jgi:NAD(P)-dependent dehydrogenase (short-subunit alcohol dehydrogenase family)